MKETTTMTAKEELVQFIVNMTPEQVNKFLNHPTAKEILAGKFDFSALADQK